MRNSVICTKVKGNTSSGWNKQFLLIIVLEKGNNTNPQTMINMHSFSIQDKTVTFQYENAGLHVSISQRSLINTPVLRSHYSKAISFCIRWPCF